MSHPPAQKRCTWCREVKPRGEFYPHRRDGLQARCRECDGIDTRSYAPAQQAMEANGWGRGVTLSSVRWTAPKKVVMIRYPDVRLNSGSAYYWVKTLPADTRLVEQVAL